MAISIRVTAVYNQLRLMEVLASEFNKFVDELSEPEKVEVNNQTTHRFLRLLESDLQLLSWKKGYRCIPRLSVSEYGFDTLSSPRACRIIGSCLDREEICLRELDFHKSVYLEIALGLLGNPARWMTPL